MRALFLLLILLATSPCFGITRVVFINGINVDDDGREASRVRIEELLREVGYREKLGADARFEVLPNLADGLGDDIAELVQQAKYSGEALTAARLIDPAATAKSLEYRRQLGRLYADKLLSEAAAPAVERRVLNFSRSIRDQLFDWVVGANDKVIFVSHSQGNFFAEAAFAYLIASVDEEKAAKASSNVRFVGVASVAASTPNNRYISADEDIALSLQESRTILVANYSLLDRNIRFCSALERLIPGDPCFKALLTREIPGFPLVHGFVPIYASDLVDKSSNKAVSKILADHISESYDEITNRPPPPPPAVEPVVLPFVHEGITFDHAFRFITAHDGVARTCYFATSGAAPKQSDLPYPPPFIGFESNAMYSPDGESCGGTYLAPNVRLIAFHTSPPWCSDGRCGLRIMACPLAARTWSSFPVVIPSWWPSAGTNICGSLYFPGDVLHHEGSLNRVVAPTSTQANGPSSFASFSADGRYVAFLSFASNLVLGDTNGALDVFVYDRQTRQTTRVSEASDGTQATGAGNFDLEAPSISADGRYVAFTSSATNLIPDDTNGGPDVFVHDRVTRQTTRVSVTTGGTQANITHPYGSRNPSLSADGRYVAFTSAASNLAPMNTLGWDNVYLHDRVAGTTVLISVAPGGVAANSSSSHPKISADGTCIVFESGSNNLLDGLPKPQFEWNIYVHDRTSGSKTRVDIPSSGDQSYQNANSFRPSISADGRFVVFESSKTNLVVGDTNETTDIFIHDRSTHTTAKVSVSSGGDQTNAGSEGAVVSGDGRFVVFWSEATNLVSNDRSGFGDTYVHDRKLGTTTRLSVAGDGTEANGESGRVTISADGRSIAFDSIASNLVSGDTNANYDVFLMSTPGR